MHPGPDPEVLVPILSPTLSCEAPEGGTLGTPGPPLLCVGDNATAAAGKAPVRGALRRLSSLCAPRVRTALRSSGGGRSYLPPPRIQGWGERRRCERARPEPLRRLTREAAAGTGEDEEVEERTHEVEKEAIAMEVMIVVLRVWRGLAAP